MGAWTGDKGGAAAEMKIRGMKSWNGGGRSGNSERANRTKRKERHKLWGIVEPEGGEVTV